MVTVVVDDQVLVPTIRLFSVQFLTLLWATASTQKGYSIEVIYSQAAISTPSRLLRIVSFVNIGGPRWTGSGRVDSHIKSVLAVCQLDHSNKWWAADQRRGLSCTLIASTLRYHGLASF